MRCGIGVIKRDILSCGAVILEVYGTDKWETDAEPMEMFTATFVRPAHSIVTASIRTNDVIGLCVTTRANFSRFQWLHINSQSYG